jgi:CheY-like chemotaxis protein
MNGYEVLEHLNQQGKLADLPVIMISALHRTRRRGLPAQAVQCHHAQSTDRCITGKEIPA